jgi:hypothetical protein
MIRDTWVLTWQAARETASRASDVRTKHDSATDADETEAELCTLLLAIAACILVATTAR